MTPPCPLCDLVRFDASASVALAIGAALGHAVADLHTITELMCAVHRSKWIMSAARAAEIVNTTHEEKGGDHA